MRQPNEFVRFLTGHYCVIALISISRQYSLMLLARHIICHKMDWLPIESTTRGLSQCGSEELILE